MATMRSQDPFLSQTDILWIFFIQFYCAGSDTEHHWRCSYSASVSYYKLQRKRERKKRERKLKLSWNLQAKCYERTKNPKLPFGSFYNPKKETPLPHTSSLPQIFFGVSFKIFKFEPSEK
jgi:hypothetical protein